MGIEDAKYSYDELEVRSTTPPPPPPIMPKLPLYSTIPSNRKEPPGLETPPPGNLAASVPFTWEDAPGKPRVAAAATLTINNSSSNRKCLIPPPPRLISTTNMSHDQIFMSGHSAKFTKVPSPKTVLEGPYMVRSRSASAWSKSFASLSTPERASSRRQPLHRRRDIKERSFSFASMGFGTNYYKDGSTSTFDFVKNITTVRRRRSSSSLLTSMYERFRRAITWKRRPSTGQKL